MDNLERLRAEVRELRDLKLTIASADEEQKLRRADLFDRVHRKLPDLFNEAGVDHLGLPAEGNLPAYDITKLPYFKANIAADWPEEKRAAAFAWLDANGGGDIIKTIIEVPLGRGERKLVQRVRRALEKIGVAFTETPGVPWNTLTAWCKEQVQEHATVPPTDILGLTMGEYVDLRERRE